MLEATVPEKRLEYCTTLTEQLLQLPLSGAASESSATRAVGYHLESGGRRTRSILVLEVCARIGVGDDDAAILAAAVEALHNASLIQDDIMDGDHTRRHQQACWKVFGRGVAICASDMLLAKAFSLCAQLNDTSKVGACIALLGEAVERTINGQCVDMDSRQWCAVVPADYVDIIAQKSIPLITLAFTLPLTYQGLDPAIPVLTEVLTGFAGAYQVIDDLADWQDDTARDRCNIVALYGAREDPQRALLLAVHHARQLLQQACGQLSGVPGILNTVIAPRVVRLQRELEDFCRALELP